MDQNVYIPSASLHLSRIELVSTRGTLCVLAVYLNQARLSESWVIRLAYVLSFVERDACAVADSDAACLLCFQRLWL